MLLYEAYQKHGKENVCINNNEKENEGVISALIWRGGEKKREALLFISLSSYM